MQKLTFKKEADFVKNEIYSVCLRGARRFDTSEELHLSIQSAVETATIVSQNSYSFYNLIDKDYADNYDLEARTYAGLLKAMNNVYSDFEDREIVTIIRFKIV